MNDEENLMLKVKELCTNAMEMSLWKTATRALIDLNPGIGPEFVDIISSGARRVNQETLRSPCGGAELQDALANFTTEARKMFRERTIP